jgi:WD40 repeat protein
LPEGRLLRREGYAVRAATADLYFESDPLAIITPLEVRYIASADGRLVLDLESPQATNSEVTPDRRLLATVDGFNVGLRATKEVDIPALVASIQQVPLPSRMHICRQHPVAALGSSNGLLKLIEIRNPSLSRVSPLPRRGAIRWLRFDDRRPFLLTADDLGNVAIVRATTADVVVPWIPHRRPLLDVAWTPTGDFAVLDEAGLLTLWRWPESTTGLARVDPDHVTKARLHGVGTLLKLFSGDGKRLLVAQADFAEIWEVSSKRLLRRFRLPEKSQVSQAAALGNVFFLTLGAAKPMFPLAPILVNKLEQPAAKQDLPALRSWKLLALDDRRDELRVIEFQMTADQHSVLVADPDGQRCVLATAAGLEVWKAAGVEREAVLPVADPVAAAFSPDGRELAVLTSGGRLRIWDVQERREIANWPVSGSAGAETELGARVVYAPSGDRICVYGRLGLRCWLRSSEQRIPMPAGLQQWISHIAFDKEGRRAITIRETSFAQVWDTGDDGTGQWRPLSQELRSEGHLAAARFGPGPSQVILRQASFSTIAAFELYRAPSIPGSVWPEREQVQIWDWRSSESLTTRQAFRDFAHDWLVDDGGRQFAGLIADETLAWPRLEPLPDYSAEWLRLLTRQYLHASSDIDSLRTLEPHEIVAEWRRLRQLKENP